MHEFLSYCTSRRYVGPEYDENGFLMSPDELNADKPESTYYEDLEKELMEEESDNSTEPDIEYHSEDEPPTNINVTIESYPPTDEAPEIDNNVSTFYAYKKRLLFIFQSFPLAEVCFQQIFLYCCTF